MHYFSGTLRKRDKIPEQKLVLSVCINESDFVIVGLVQIVFLYKEIRKS